MSNLCYCGQPWCPDRRKVRAERNAKYAEERREYKAREAEAGRQYREKRKRLESLADETNRETWKLEKLLRPEETP